MLKQSLLLKRWRNAWKICESLKEPTSWREFANTAMKDFNIELAVRIFRNLGDVAMVWALGELLIVEDRQILGGHIASLLGDFDLADKLFCDSSEPKLALEMRRDIQHWERALELATQIAPNELPYIAKEYAIQLEFMGQHEQSFHYFKQAIIQINEEDEINNEELDEHNWVCKSGLARMALHIGDLKKGVEIALQLPSKLAKRDCGIVLEQLKQFDEAGAVYEAGQFYDRAAAAYLKTKNLLKVHKLMEKVRSPKLLCQYGKMLEREKNFERAYKAYEKAQDAENQIRVLLRHLNKAEQAVNLAKESKSIEGSKLIANYFSDLGQFDKAIQFLVISLCYQEAFDLAKSSGHIQIYSDELENCNNNSQLLLNINDNSQQQKEAAFNQMAEFFRNEGNVLEAGKFFGMSKQYRTALSLLTSELITPTAEETALQFAVEFVAESKEKSLIDELISHLMGEREGGDGIPKDPKYLFQLYVKLSMHEEGAKTALIIAQEQQFKGFYKTAHDLLFEMYQTLRRENIRIHSEMENALMLLHSYNIVKGLLKRGDNFTAAKLLCRVSENIGQFPAHATQILTSCVITCTKAGLKKSAFKTASLLLQPLYRQKIDEKYKKKIELVVRKFGQNSEDPEERLQPCPYCGTSVNEFMLGCNNCQANIPYCILTGRHIVREDFSTCPKCNFPGNLSEFYKLTELICPMCYGQFNKEEIEPINFSDFIIKNSNIE
ncbi:hypothetical protein Mgra_00006192 [Meloidogyne graminicola]|uniref:Uncharacterized protein n=1 Tax=Meloidogyne graminicola TaxID=189291 RepID=A0A8S9ZLX2_9BILA|nr:hypothetical protein Mgra_00006192 [Meloidogyne graminicola]